MFVLLFIFSFGDLFLPRHLPALAPATFTRESRPATCRHTHLRSDISNRYSKDFVHKIKQKVIEKIVFPYGNKIYIQSRLNLKGWE